jgi:valyl-tRNA synthetase
MENTRDWNISRQIVWGIAIPAWLCDTCGTHKAALGTTPPSCDQCHQTMRKESDTFDTWFSSGQWPLLVTDYPNGKDYKTYYPTDVMETGHDLIFKWVPRMVIFGLYLGKRAPFHTVYLHGLVNDAQGKKMSKSKGNVVNPLDLTAKYGTDALRMGLVVGNTPGSDLALREDKIKAYKLFANKLWNITRFVFSTTEGVSFSSDSVLTAHDQTILDELDTTTKDITADMENYRFYMAGEKIYHYVWNTFADKIIEENKERLFENEDAADKASAQLLLMRILERSLVLLHPFMPFITEEIWGTLPNRPHPLIVAPWPSVK